MAEVETKVEEKVAEEIKSEEVKEEKKEEAGAEATTPAEEKAEEETKEEEKKEEEPPKVILHQFPRVKNIPSASLFSLKLETFLRLYKVPYENQFGYKVSKKGKIPWIEYKGERKADSDFIIDFLNEKFELNINSDFSDCERALGRAVKSMVEENTYWVLSYDRHIQHFNEYRNVAAPAGMANTFTMKMAARRMENSLAAQGIGRHSKEEVYSIGEKDLKALSDLLGEKEYLLGEKPSSFDCTLFALIAQVVYLKIESSPLLTYLQENADNLVKYCERVKQLCWEDWKDQCEPEKPETEKKSGFSIRRKHKYTPNNGTEAGTTNEAVKTESTVPSDEKAETTEPEKAETTEKTETTPEEKAETGEAQTEVKT